MVINKWINDFFSIINYHFVVVEHWKIFTVFMQKIKFKKIKWKVREQKSAKINV